MTTASRALHAALVLAAGPVWLLAYLLLVVCACLVIAADRVLPHARVGNCWSYAAPRWLRHGGYLAIRASRGARLSGGMVPHAIWLRDLPDGAHVRQTVPLRPRSGRWLPWHIFYFSFRVTSRES